MATRAISLLNDLLKLFNTDDTEYKNLIGDISKTTYIDYSGNDSEYSTALEENMNEPDDQYDQNDCYIPLTNAASDFRILVGDWQWNYNGVVGSSKTILGATAGASYGTIKISANVSNWTNFGIVGDNGLQKIYFPKLANDDKVGGYIEIYFDSVAFTIAFSGNQSDIIITQHGFVYKGSVTFNNLVTTYDGIVGPAGSGSEKVIVKIADINTGAIGDVVEYFRRLSQYLISQLDLQTASGDWLNWIGTYIYGIVRRAGETDVDYITRIVAFVMGIKLSPLAIRDVLLPYADDVIIEDGFEMGMFSDVSFTDYYFRMEYPPETVKAAITGINGGIPFYFRVLMDNPDLTKGTEIVDLIERYRVSGTSYDIFII